jgi:hypothetical protein
MSVEVELKRRNTKAFIDSNPVVITLIPRSPFKSGTGTRLVDQKARAAQTFRLVDLSGSGGTSPGIVASADGKQRKVEFQAIGNWDATILVGDYWLDGSDRLEVAELLPYNGYERRAMVVRYGQG